MRHTAIIEAISFLLLILLVWLNELLDLPHHLLGAPADGAPLRLEEALLETLVIVGVGVFVLFATGILSRRIRALESFIVVCAWCRKVRLDQEWTVQGKKLSALFEISLIRVTQCEKGGGSNAINLVPATVR